MTDRPVGIYLICGFFVLLGLSSFVSGLSLPNQVTRDIAERAPSVELFLSIYPVLLLLFGFLGLFAGVTIWYAKPIGRVSGLLWLGLWLAEELIITVWSITGPELIQDINTGVGTTFVRIIVAILLFHYLWTTGAVYVSNDTDSHSRTFSTNT